MSVFTILELDKIKTQLPHDFYHYLTNISSNLVVYFSKHECYDNKNCDYHPKFYDQIEFQNKIKLEVWCTLRKTKVFIPGNIISIYKIQEDLQTCNPLFENKLKKNDIRSWMIEIGEGWYDQITYRYLLFVGEGPHFGSVWLDCNESFDYYDFYFVKVFATFTRFLNAVNEYKTGNNANMNFDDQLFLSEYE
jgi:hypothetical protein